MTCVPNPNLQIEPYHHWLPSVTECPRANVIPLLIPSKLLQLKSKIVFFKNIFSKTYFQQMLFITWFSIHYFQFKAVTHNMLIEQDNVNLRNQTLHHKMNWIKIIQLILFTKMAIKKKNCNPIPKSRISVLDPAVDNVFNNFTFSYSLYL